MERVAGETSWRRRWRSEPCPGRPRGPEHPREAGRCTSALAESGRAAGSDCVANSRAPVNDYGGVRCAEPVLDRDRDPALQRRDQGPAHQRRDQGLPLDQDRGPALQRRGQGLPSTRTGARPSNARTRARPSRDSACCEHSQSSSWSWWVTVIAEFLRRPPRPRAPAQPPRPREGRSRPDQAGL